MREAVVFLSRIPLYKRRKKGYNMDMDRFEVTIIDIGMNGEGVGRLAGGPCFVPFALPGEVVEAETVAVRKGVTYARLVRVLTASPDRQEPLCPVFGECGGCQLQHMRYGRQLSVKARTVENCFRKIAKLSVSAAAVGKSAEIYRYRNKLQLPVGGPSDAPVMGFFRDNTHAAVPIADCPLHPAWNAALMRILGAFMRAFGVSGYDERSHTGIVRHLVAREVQGKLMVVPVINAPALPHAAAFSQMVLAEFPDASIWINCNRARTNVILGEQFQHLAGPQLLYGEAMGVRYGVHPNSFVQVNDAVRDRIYAKVAELVGDQPDGCVVDAYSGAGLLTAVLSRHCRQVYGIEIVPQAVESADELCRQNNIENMRNLNGDCALLLPQLVRRLRGIADSTACEKAAKNTKNAKGTGKNSDFLQEIPFGAFRDAPITVVLDPPRKGCDVPVLRALLEAAPEKIVYVSCNPATLARDAGLLLGTLAMERRPAAAPSYEISYIKPFDLFPQTKHVETVALFSRQDVGREKGKTE